MLLLSEPLLTLLPAAPEVHSDHQRKGVGKLLIQAAEIQAGKGQMGALKVRGALAVSVYRKSRAESRAVQDQDLFLSGEGDVECPAYGLRKLPVSSGQVILPESCSLL